MKYNQVQKEAAKKGHGFSTFKVLFDKIPENIKNKLNSREIAELIDLLYDQKIYGENEMFYELFDHDQNELLKTIDENMKNTQEILNKLIIKR